ncbi:MAG: hypothetical protein JWO18_1469 [Microbacteriaceae bacterium]|nr:hypothetical protein [Microbacteriaceae bacterium]
MVVVQQHVMMSTEEHAVGNVCLSVISVRPETSAVASAEGHPLSGREQPLLATHVEACAIIVECDGHDACVAGVSFDRFDRDRIGPTLDSSMTRPPLECSCADQHANAGASVAEDRARIGVARDLHHADESVERDLVGCPLICEQFLRTRLLRPGDNRGPPRRGEVTRSTAPSPVRRIPDRAGRSA